jgi:hypothetical protein
MSDWLSDELRIIERADELRDIKESALFEMRAMKVSGMSLPEAVAKGMADLNKHGLGAHWPLYAIWLSEVYELTPQTTEKKKGWFKSA